MKNILVIFCLPLWVFLSTISVHAADFHAKVIHITDGDTISGQASARGRITELLVTNY